MVDSERSEITDVNQNTEDNESTIINTENETPDIARKKLSSEHFLNKHSPSFTCFEQYLCSQSDLQITLNFFPPLTDPGLDDALSYMPIDDETDPYGINRYTKICKDLTIVPIKRVIKSLPTDTLNLKYYGLTLKQMRGIADALKVNGNVKYLIFQDSWMSTEATDLISEILRESNSIRVLNLRECQIGEEGAEKLCEGISSTQFLQDLDLSYNNLGDRGLNLLQTGLIENTSIKRLNISHNKLTEISGATLEKIFLENKSLQELDLSWNSFYTGPGNKKLCNGLQKSNRISWLSLAWNGIGAVVAMRPISKYLRATDALKFLDLSWNRIARQALRRLRGALIKNTSLETVKIGNNIYDADEAYFLADALTKIENITLLDMENMCVNKNFLQLKAKLFRRGQIVNHGLVLSNYEIYGPDVRKLLFKRCKYLAMKPKKIRAKKDFGHFVLSLPDKPITTQEFYDLLKKYKIKTISKDKDLIQELTAHFLTKSRKVDCAVFKSAFMRFYPDTILPPEKKKRKKERKKKRAKK